MMRPAATKHRPDDSPAVRGLEASGGLEGFTLSTAAGSAFCVESLYPMDFSWGLPSLGQLATVPPHGWSRWLPWDDSRELDPRAVAFVDTETTGLQRGTGTYAFLIGIGRLTPQGFRVRQFLLRDVYEEPAVLEAVLAELDGVCAVITYNGLRFDWPLLQTRLTMNRLPVPPLPQLDLLYPARRLWKPTVGDCRLGSLEEAVLGITRRDDVPGYLIPSLYFRYLQTKDPAPLAGVVRHNRWDILTTAALAAYVGQAMAQPLEAAPLGRPLPGSDLLAIGCRLLERREWDEAVACLEEALRRGLPDSLQGKCRKALAAAYRRMGWEERSAHQWRALAEGGGLSPGPCVELAKYYEHRVKDLEKARLWTLRAIEAVQRRRLLRLRRGATLSHAGSFHDQQMQELLHRLRRLEAKLARQAPQQELRDQQLVLGGW